MIAKIESRTGIANMDGIVPAADAVLIDRGDLSREVPIEQIPYYQKAIVRRANRWHRPAYVATNLLESMVTNKLPTVAEANDIANSLLDGVHGLVLAAETAMGSTRWAPWTSCCARCAPSRAPTAATCSPTGPAPGRRRLGRGAATGASWSRPGTGPERAPRPLRRGRNGRLPDERKFSRQAPVTCREIWSFYPGSCTIHVTHQR